MRYVSLILLLYCVGVLGLDVTPGLAQTEFDPHTVDEFVETERAAQHIPGMALAITRGGQVLYVKGYGMADGEAAVTPQTQFFIASLSKSFTALAVMQLVEAGKVDLDAPVQRYLPDLTLSDPVVAKQITVRQLLHHLSGLADAGFPHMRLPQPNSPGERIASLRSARPVSEPGTKYNYFDVNYQILAAVVEAVSGEPFSEYLKSHIFSPLGMNHTLSVLTSAEAMERAGGLARGHLLSFGLPVASKEEQGYLAGSGGVVSTAEDMAHYLATQTSGGSYQGIQVLSPAGVALMHTPPAEVDSSYAMGWMAAKENGTRTIEHNGILSTFYSEVALLPDSGYGIALLYNVQSVTQNLVGFPDLKKGLIALLVDQAPATGGWTAGMVGALLALLAAVSVVLSGHSLLRLPRWAEKSRSSPRWRLVPGIVWAFVPAALVLAMPILVLDTGGRAFSLFTLSRSMLGVMTWLGAWAALSAADGIGRIILLAREARRRSTSTV